LTELGVVCTPVIPALRRVRQEDYQLEAYLGYITSSRIVWTTLQNPVIPSFINKQITNELILVVSN
jgi:hypothetical protein